MADLATSAQSAPPQAPKDARARKRPTLGLGLERFSGLYVWGALILLFGT